MALQVDPAICLLAGNRKLHKLHVMASIGVQVLALYDHLLRRVLVDFKLCKELAILNVPNTDLGVDACRDQISWIEYFEAVDDCALVREDALNSLRHRVVE